MNTGWTVGTGTAWYVLRWQWFRWCVVQEMILWPNPDLGLSSEVVISRHWTRRKALHVLNDLTSR